ncbi:MAG: FKBP-type peptidyl-prolyl cis-trans isomerase [Acidimicrobiales bacterium]
MLDAVRPHRPQPRAPRRVRATMLLAGLALTGVTACGDGDTATAGSSPSSTDGTASTAQEPTMSKPTVSVPGGAEPTELVIEDLVTGTGAEAVAGKPVAVHYVGVHFTDGSQFDASWDRGEPFTFQLGGGQVIQGWDQGVVGMKVGGRRQLTIPGSLAYGANGFPPVIQPNETLVFVVDLLAVGG